MEKEVGKKYIGYAITAMDTWECGKEIACKKSFKKALEWQKKFQEDPKYNGKKIIIEKHTLITVEDE